jgi:hypothetical protein
VSTPRYLLNRSVVIIRHKQPFLDWLLTADPNPLKDLNLAHIEEEGDAFLIPGDPKINDHAQAVKWVEKRWQGFFEYFLNEWLTDEALWPQNRSIKMFRQWFKFEYPSMIWDMAADQPLEVEEWDEEVEDDGPNDYPHLH